jgi:hypothetical protein
VTGVGAGWAAGGGVKGHIEVLQRGRALDGVVIGDLIVLAEAVVIVNQRNMSDYVSVVRGLTSNSDAFFAVRRATEPFVYSADRFGLPLLAPAPTALASGLLAGPPPYLLEPCAPPALLLAVVVE